MCPSLASQVDPVQDLAFMQIDCDYCTESIERDRTKHLNPRLAQWNATVQEYAVRALPDLRIRAVATPRLQSSSVSQRCCNVDLRGVLFVTPIARGAPRVRRGQVGGVGALPRARLPAVLLRPGRGRVLVLV